jgi:hypothetical protein
VTDPTECRDWSKDEVIELSFPVQNDLMVLARITGATVAATAGFAVDAVEDFRLAVEELCLLVQRHRGGILHLAFLPSEGGVEVRCHLSSAQMRDAGVRQAGDDREAGDDMAYQFSRQILDSISDEWGEGSDGPQPYMWFRMGADQMVDEV